MTVAPLDDVYRSVPAAAALIPSILKSTLRAFDVSAPLICTPIAVVTERCSCTCTASRCPTVYVAVIVRDVYGPFHFATSVVASAWPQKSRGLAGSADR